MFVDDGLQPMDSCLLLSRQEENGSQWLFPLEARLAQMVDKTVGEVEWPRVHRHQGKEGRILRSTLGKVETTAAASLCEVAHRKSYSSKLDEPVGCTIRFS